MSSRGQQRRKVTLEDSDSEDNVQDDHDTRRHRTTQAVQADVHRLMTPSSGELRGRTKKAGVTMRSRREQEEAIDIVGSGDGFQDDHGLLDNQASSAVPRARRKTVPRRLLSNNGRRSTDDNVDDDTGIPTDVDSWDEEGEVGEDILMKSWSGKRDHIVIEESSPQDGAGSSRSRVGFAQEAAMEAGKEEPDEERDPNDT